MNLRVRGEAIPFELLQLIGSLTDRARLRPADVAHDSESGRVHFPIVRLPLIKQRRFLPNIHDHRHPVHAMVTVRNVTSARIEPEVPGDVGEYVTLLFGIQFKDGKVTCTSAEEDRGEPFLSAELEVSALDIEIVDGEPAHVEAGG